MTSSPTSYPTSAPTSTPTSSPTYGPSSTDVVVLIEGTIIGGIFLVFVIYLVLGYYSYESDLAEYLENERLCQQQEELVESRKSQNEEDHYLGEESEDSPLLRHRKL